MKYRIKVRTMKDGSKVYTPQYRFLFLWTACGVYDYSTLSSAQQVIDRWIETDNHFTSVNTDYIKYP